MTDSEQTVGIHELYQRKPEDADEKQQKPTVPFVTRQNSILFNAGTAKVGLQ